jgi:mono/diheme cytochrome c family protein
MFGRYLSLVLAGILGVTLPSLALESGLQVTFTSQGKSDVRVDRLLALYVPAQQCPTPFLPVGPFTAKWEGNIESPVRGTFNFSVETNGKIKLTLNGKVLLTDTEAKTAELNQGANTLVAELTSATQGDTFLRLNWSSKNFPLEPVPPAVFTHAANPTLEQATALRQGRLLFAQYNCVACHADAKVPRTGGMPELNPGAPLLADLGKKYRPEFLAEWIDHPASIRPHTLMPKLFSGPDAAQKAADLAAMLTQGATPDGGKLEAAQVAAGGALFANLGCIACHAQPDQVDTDKFDRIPLGHVQDKYRGQVAPLVAYLKNPAANYPQTRMPNFRLSDEEAGQLANYLLANGRMIKRKALQGDATRGATLLATAGCLNCHAGMPPTTQPPLSKVLQSPTRGCLAPSAQTRGTAPDFSFNAAQRQALQAFLATDLSSLQQDTPAEFAERQIANLQCTACHARDGKISRWAQLDGECKKLREAVPAKEHQEGDPVPDAPIPALTWQGEKLKTAWMTSFIAGEVAYKPRTWLIGRMPGFAHSTAANLAIGLAHQHGFPTVEPTEAEPNLEKAKIGETLVGNDGGFNCITCHGLGERPPTAVFEAPAINFVQTIERVRKGYFLRWVMAPTRIDAETKMPKYADPEGVTAITDQLEGKGPDQFEAIREYLRTVK